jgi:hypothetical protein
VTADQPSRGAFWAELPSPAPGYGQPVPASPERLERSQHAATLTFLAAQRRKQANR